MSGKKTVINDPDLQKVEKALIRASKKARERSILMNTSFLVFQDGKIVDLNAPNPAK